MIAEIFLTCALAPAVMAFTNDPYTTGVLLAHKAVIHSAQFILRRKVDMDRNTLIVGGDPGMVKTFRENGYKTFGALTDDRPGVTPWHVVTNSDAMAFQSRVFHSLFFLQNNPTRDTEFTALKEAVRLIAGGGFLIFSEELYEDWPHLLRLWNWERLPVRWADYAIWKRPVQHDGFSYSYKNTMKQMGKNVVPFKQLWAMRKMAESA